jgi:hypothetical protein
VIPGSYQNANVPAVSASVDFYLDRYYSGSDWNSEMISQTFGTVNVKVRNIGIYDSTKIRGDKECSKCEGYFSMQDCQLKCFVDLVVKICECVPFIHRRLFKGDVEGSKLPLCTVGCYLQRGKSASSAVETETWSKCKVDLPCVAVQNAIAFTRAGMTAGNNYKLHFAIAFPDSTYVVFSNICQNGPFEMLGQLGGNLGTFI